MSCYCNGIYCKVDRSMNNFQREREGVNKIQQNNTKYARFSLEKNCVLFYILQFFSSILLLAIIWSKHYWQVPLFVVFINIFFFSHVGFFSRPTFFLQQKSAFYVGMYGIRNKCSDNFFPYLIMFCCCFFLSFLLYVSMYVRTAQEQVRINVSRNQI